MWQFIQSLKQLAQKNVVKTQIKAGLAAKFLDQEEPEPVDVRNPLPKKQKINQLASLFQRASTDETSKIQGKADEIVQRIEYYELFKHRDMDENNNSRDPQLKYFKKCLEQNSLLLPIFEKIYSKTLCLQNYILSDGHCQGIAEACQYIDHKRMNRVLFNNCGITGNNMAIILDGLAKVKDFKSIIYKHNELNSLAVAKLEAIFLKFIPNQLMDLQIVDCKIHCSTIEQLLDLMITRCEVKSFALVNVHHSEGSF